MLRHRGRYSIVIARSAGLGISALGGSVEVTWYSGKVLFRALSGRRARKNMSRVSENKCSEEQAAT